MSLFTLVGRKSLVVSMLCGCCLGLPTGIENHQNWKQRMMISPWLNLSNWITRKIAQNKRIARLLARLCLVFELCGAMLETCWWALRGSLAARRYFAPVKPILDQTAVFLLLVETIIPCILILDINTLGQSSHPCGIPIFAARWFNHPQEYAGSITFAATKDQVAEARTRLRMSQSRSFKYVRGMMSIYRILSVHPSVHLQYLSTYLRLYDSTILPNYSIYIM